MMNKFFKSVKDHSPVILAILAGITGTAAIGTAVYDTFKAIEKCPEIDDNVYLQPDFPRVEVLKKVAPCYIPTLILWAVSLSCTIGSVTLSKKQKASLISAYMILNTAYSDYIAKNKQEFGDWNHDHIVAEMAKDRYRKTAHPHEENTKLYYEGYYGEYFESTPEKVLKAEYELNRRLIANEMVTIGEFFDLLDLGQTEASELGWSTWKMFDWQDSPWIEIRHDPIMMDDGLECEILEFVVPPAPDYAEDF